MNLQSQSLEEAFQGLKMDRKTLKNNQTQTQIGISLNQKIPSSLFVS